MYCEKSTHARGKREKVCIKKAFTKGAAHVIIQRKKGESMQKFLYTDGDKIGVFDGEQCRLLESEYIVRYRENAANRVKNGEWKYTGEGARFRGDYDRFREQNERVYAYINGVQWAGDSVLYSFTVNGSSGVYRKEIANDAAREGHVITLNEKEICSIHCNGNSGLLAVTVRDGATSHIGILDCATAELKTYTDGDARDENPFFSATEADTVYFNSAGAGRLSDGSFSGRYSPSVVCKLNLQTLEITEVLKDRKLSYIKPKQDSAGNLYCIERPNKEKSGGNPFVEIAMIPVRIVQAVVLFVQAFVTVFTGKSMTAGGENPAKGREQDSRKLYVDGNLIHAEKELKRNKRFKDKEYGFIPRSWKLVKFGEDGKNQTLRAGVCDFALCDDGGIYCTDGKHVLYLNEGGIKRVATADMCLCVAAESHGMPPTDVFQL